MLPMEKSVCVFMFLFSAFLRLYNNVEIFAILTKMKRKTNKSESSLDWKKNIYTQNVRERRSTYTLAHNSAKEGAVER